MEESLRKFCFDAPHWMQIQMQGLWYGMISWRIECMEDGKPLKKQTIQEYLNFAEPELESWPSDWLQPTVDEFTGTEMTLDELTQWFETVHTIFQDCIPADLNIFTVLATGETLSDEQWKRLYDTVAFMPPKLPAVNDEPKQTVVPVQQPAQKRRKTRRTHGRRAITPIKGRRAHTHHRSHVQATVVKMQ